MNRDEFSALPASVALGILWDAFPGLEKKLADVVAPKRPRPPKYDQAIYRKEGVQWASETDVEGLRFWRARYTASAQKGGEYAAKDLKRSDALGFWIAWRLAEPMTQWSGERNREQVTAKMPSGKPAVYPRDGSRRPAAAPQDDADFDNATGDEPAFDDSNLPF